MPKDVPPVLNWVNEKLYTIVKSMGQRIQKMRKIIGKGCCVNSMNNSITVQRILSFSFQFCFYTMIISISISEKNYNWEIQFYFPYLIEKTINNSFKNWFRIFCTTFNNLNSNFESHYGSQGWGFQHPVTRDCAGLWVLDLAQHL